MYLRETRRRNRNGSEVSYLALAHNERDPDTGMPRATIIHSFGRADQVDREGLARLVRSISRFLDPAEAVAAGASGEVRIIDARPMGTSWVVARLWERRRVYIEGLAELTDDACYRTMDFLLQALPEIQEAVFFSVANLLNLEVDIVFFDTTSTYWEADGADPALLDDDEAGGQRDGGAEVPGEVPGDDTEAGGFRTWGHSKDHRPDLPQVVIGMAVTREGIPVRVWTFPGSTSDQVLIRTVKDDLRAWRLNRVIWVLDRGFASAENRRYLQRGGGHYIMGEKLRSDSKEAAAALSRQGRYHTVAGNLRVKEVRVDDGTARDRFVVCHNPEQATRDAEVRAQIVERLQGRIAGTDALGAKKRATLAGQ